MGIVAEDAVNQLEASMKQGQLLWSSHLVVFSSGIFFHIPLLFFHFWQLMSLWRKHSRFPLYSTCPICSSSWVNLVSVWLFRIIYSISHIKLPNFWLLADVNLQVMRLVFFHENVFFCLCLWNLVTLENHGKWGSLFDLLNCLFGGILGIWQLRCGAPILFNHLLDCILESSLVLSVVWGDHLKISYFIFPPEYSSRVSSWNSGAFS